MIAEFSASRNMKCLAFYYKGKLLFRNSTIYKQNISLRKLAKKFGCSHPAAKKYLKELKTLGLTRELGGNITFVSINKTDFQLRKKNQTKIAFNKNDSIKDITTKLKFSLIKKSCENQQFLIGLKKQLKSAKAIVSKGADKNKATISKKVYKKYLQPLSEKLRNTINEKPQLSTRTIAKQLKCSKQNLTELKRKFVALGLCQFKREFQVLGKVNRKHFMNNSDIVGGNCFVSRNGIGYKSLPSSIILGGMGCFK